MNKWLFFFFTIIATLSVKAQTLESKSKESIQYGYLHYDSIFKSMPEYTAAEQSFRELKAKYDKEISYNENNFKRLFAEFLQGQKDFPQNILLKRQRELQDEMERGLAFRKDADSLLNNAHADFLRPVQKQLNQAIHRVGQDKGLLFIINLDNNSFPFVNPLLGKDITQEVLEQLRNIK